MRVLASLAADVFAAGESLAMSRTRTPELDALRQAARELAMLVDACGGGALQVAAANHRSPAHAVAFVAERYRSALEAPLPRALREALRAQLSRLEASFATAHAA